MQGEHVFKQRTVSMSSGIFQQIRHHASHIIFLYVLMCQFSVSYGQIGMDRISLGQQPQLNIAPKTNQSTPSRAFIVKARDGRYMVVQPLSDLNMLSNIARIPSGQSSRRPSLQLSHIPLMQSLDRSPVQPSQVPSVQPQQRPSVQPQHRPSVQPSQIPLVQPQHRPSVQPTQISLLQLLHSPSVQPSQIPLAQLLHRPSVQPPNSISMQLANRPSVQQTHRASVQPSNGPSMQLSHVRLSQPPHRPSVQPPNRALIQMPRRPAVQPPPRHSGQISHGNTLPSSLRSSVKPMQRSAVASIQPTAQTSNKLPPSSLIMAAPSILTLLNQFRQQLAKDNLLNKGSAAHSLRGEKRVNSGPLSNAQILPDRQSHKGQIINAKEQIAPDNRRTQASAKKGTKLQSNRGGNTMTSGKLDNRHVSSVVGEVVKKGSGLVQSIENTAAEKPKSVPTNNIPSKTVADKQSASTFLPTNDLRSAIEQALKQMERSLSGNPSLMADNKSKLSSKGLNVGLVLSKSPPNQGSIPSSASSNPPVNPNFVQQAPTIGQAPAIGQAPSVRQAPAIGQAPNIRQAPSIGQAQSIGQAPSIGHDPWLYHTPSLPFYNPPLGFADLFGAGAFFDRGTRGHRQNMRFDTTTSATTAEEAAANAEEAAAEAQEMTEGKVTNQNKPASQNNALSSFKSRPGFTHNNARINNVRKGMQSRGGNFNVATNPISGIHHGAPDASPAATPLSEEAKAEAAENAEAILSARPDPPANSTVTETTPQAGKGGSSAQNVTSSVVQ